jgi:SNF2 family DNA or RNA helicase
METQKLVAAHMVLHPRSFVFSDMRTGKTRAALWACDWLMSKTSKRTRTLVVTDIEAMTKTWVPEINGSFCGRRTFAVLHGSSDQRVAALRKDVDFYLINHDGLRVGYDRDKNKCRGLAKALLARNDIQLAVFDEAATYRNRTTLCSLSARRLVAERAAFAWALTGTPTPNGPLDAYGLKKLIDPAFAMPYHEWVDKVTESVNQFRRAPRKGSEEAVSLLLSPAVRISRDQCFTESPLEQTTVRAEMSKDQVVFMKKLQEELLAMLENGPEISAVNQAALRAKLIQAACGAIYDSEHNVHFIDATPRLEKFDQLVREAEGKVVVFSPLTSVVHMLQKRVGASALMISRGTQTDAVRRQVVSDFVTGPAKVLCSHPAPISRGLDLTCASTIIWYAPVDRTEYYLQANQRINGPRQKRVRRIFRLSGSKVEDEIYRKLEHNEHMQGAILKLKEMRL